MGTCYYLARSGDGALFDLDKAYGLAAYLRADRCNEDDGGLPCSLGDDLNTLVGVLALVQPGPCCHERVAWAQRMLEFASGHELRLYSEHDVPYPENGMWPSASVIGERWTKDALEHTRDCQVPHPDLGPSEALRLANALRCAWECKS